MPSRAELEAQLRQLLDYPREDLDTEYKRWLDLGERKVQADLARELLALANHGGGTLVLGFEESSQGLIAQEHCAFGLDLYTQDTINGLIKRYADPVFHCTVTRLTSSAGNEHVAVVVPGNHEVPVRASRGGPPDSRLAKDQYYTRHPGPDSAPVATAREWDEILGRCVAARQDELVERFRSIVLALRGPGSPAAGDASGVLADLVGGSRTSQELLREWEDECRARLQDRIREELPREQPSRYIHGTWSSAYILEGATKPPRNLPSLLELLTEVRGHETGWPPWWVPDREGIRPRPIDHMIECWLNDESPFSDAAHSDFWRADLSGRIFLLRGYQEDAGPDAPIGATNVKPGGCLDLILPIWRTGECLLHAERYARRVNARSVTFQMRWTGLAGRELAQVASRDRFLSAGRQSLQEEVRTTVEAMPTAISDTLPELVRRLVEPLYTAFDFFKPADGIYTDELSRMRSRSY